jgi:hypothetical protein
MLCTEDNEQLRLLVEAYQGMEVKVRSGPRNSVTGMRRIRGAVEDYWRGIGGACIKNAKLADGVTVPGLIIENQETRELAGSVADMVHDENVCLIHSYFQSLGMWVAGEAIVAAALVRTMGARSVRSVIVVRQGDTAIEAALRLHLETEIVVSQR